MNRVASFSVLLLLINLFAASGYADLRSDFESAHASFLSFFDDNKDKYFDTAWEQFEQLDAQHPDHPAVQTYYGALETIKANRVLMPWSKIKWAERGLDRIDRAMTLLGPEHVKENLIGIPVATDSRIAATTTLLAVPGFMNRIEDAKAVFADLLDTTDMESMPAVVQHRIYQLGVDIANKSDDKQQLEEWSGRRDAVVDNSQ
ncbi:MAG: hypothetical protein V3U76_17215 [Granulosicoccus sp.]